MNEADRARRDLTRERMLFGLLFLLQTSLYAWLVLDRRLMKTHDTLYEYQLQYLFLCHSTQSPDLALWFPCSLHGVISNWLAIFQGSLFQNVLLLAGGVPEGTSMLPVFYLGVFLDEFILLLGIWGLARRLYPSVTTRFFVAAAVIGSTFWATQFNFTLKLLFGVPLLLTLIHQFLDDGKRWPLFLAANFSALQLSGTIPYIPVLTLLVVFVYFLIHALIFPHLWSHRLRNLRPRPADLMVVLLNAAVLIAVYANLSNGASEIRQYRPGRDIDGQVTLDAFLTYAGTLSPGRYVDFFLGATPSMDYTLYSGVCVPILALVALLARPGRQVLHLVLCLLAVLFFSMGFLSPVAAAVFEFVPPMRYFRYVSLAAPFAKLFLILLSGHGVEALVGGKQWRSPLIKGLLNPVLVTLAGITTLLLLVLGGGAISDVLGVGSSGLANRGNTTANIPVVFAGAFTLVFGGFLALAHRGSLSARTCVALLLALETTDVFRWKVTLFREETVALNDAQAALMRIRPLPYIPRRTTDERSSERYRILEPIFSEHGARYDLIESFCHLEPPLTHYMFSFWMQPFESLIQAGNGQPPDRRMKGLPGISPRHLGPDARGAIDAYSKILGITADKIQIFRDAHDPGSDQALADVLNHPEFKGDLLLLSTGPGHPESSRSVLPEQLGADERIDVRPEILHFDMNVLSVKVQLPPGQAGGWLFYGEVWNSGWTATVNGKPVPVERAFLAYKAVKLEPGANLVSFRFQAPIRLWAYRVVGLSSLFFIASLIALACRLVSDPGFLTIRRFK